MSSRDHSRADANSFNVFEALGMIVAVAMDSHYSDWSIAEVEQYLVPALKAHQCKVYVDDRNGPAAFVTWALLDDECHQAMLQGKNPPPDRWRSGENLWFMDIVAPYGDAPRIIRDLQCNVFPDRHAHSVKRSPDGSIVRIKKWRNALAERRS